jgi:hypothetical protein
LRKGKILVTIHQREVVRESARRFAFALLHTPQPRDVDVAVPGHDDLTRGQMRYGGQVLTQALGRFLY